MSGWNRLFILVAICWAVVAPFWIRAETNAPIEQTYRSTACATSSPSEIFCSRSKSGP
jgi:hypothetical protein